MGTFKEIDGDLIKLALEGKFDVVAHGCNCFCTMGSGIAPQMVKAFGTDEFLMEQPSYKGDINKLGTIDYGMRNIDDPKTKLLKTDNKFIKGLHVFIVNSYTQYNYGANHSDGDKKPVDYDAITMVMRKMNHVFKGKHIGLPKIGAGLAGGDWNVIEGIIKKELKDCDVTIVNYKP